MKLSMKMLMKKKLRVDAFAPVKAAKKHVDEINPYRCLFYISLESTFFIWKFFAQLLGMCLQIGIVNFMEEH